MGELDEFYVDKFKQAFKELLGVSINDITVFDNHPEYDVVVEAQTASQAVKLLNQINNPNGSFASDLASETNVGIAKLLSSIKVIKPEWVFGERGETCRSACKRKSKTCQNNAVMNEPQLLFVNGLVNNKQCQGKPQVADFNGYDDIDGKCYFKTLNSGKRASCGYANFWRERLFCCCGPKNFEQYGNGQYAALCALDESQIAPSPTPTPAPSRVPTNAPSLVPSPVPTKAPTPVPLPTCDVNSVIGQVHAYVPWNSWIGNNPQMGDTFRVTFIDGQSMLQCPGIDCSTRVDLGIYKGIRSDGNGDYMWYEDGDSCTTVNGTQIGRYTELRIVETGDPNDSVSVDFEQLGGCGHKMTLRLPSCPSSAPTLVPTPAPTCDVNNVIGNVYAYVPVNDWIGLYPQMGDTFIVTFIVGQPMLQCSGIDCPLQCPGIDCPTRVDLGIYKEIRSDDNGDYMWYEGGDTDDCPFDVVNGTQIQRSRSTILRIVETGDPNDSVSVDFHPLIGCEHNMTLRLPSCP